MKRFFTLFLGALTMLAVALISAFIAMRLAIHGREAVVPALAGMSLPDATDAAAAQGLQLTLENRFYSASVGAGHVLAQDPPPGSRVRREWHIRITESLGPQQVNVPDLEGQSEREATVNIRRLGLDLGTVVHLASSGNADVVLAQTPMADAGSADSPRVSLLVGDPSQASPAAYVMPSLIGLNFYSANLRAASAGLHLEVPTQPAPTPDAGVAPAPAAAAPLPSVESALSAIVVAQTPQPGSRVQQGDVVHVAMGPMPSPASAAP